MKKRRIVGLIPARGGSRGIFKKNLVDLCGLPLLAYTILAAYDSVLDEVWVSSDDKDTLNTAKIYGAKPLKRPDKLCKDTSTTESAVDHFLKHVKCDIVVLIQATSPFLTSEDINRGVEKFLTGKYDSVFSAVRPDDMLIWKVRCENSPYAVPKNYNPRNRGRRQTRGANPYMIESGGFFIFSKKFFNRAHCRMGKKVGYVEIPYWKSFQVDTKEDLINISRMMARG
jgi:N-acylneuraminate cytidylyltransferase